jgi:CheY-like chemotaxis protein
MEPIRILLVDDEARFVENLARILRARGRVVDTAPDGASALSRLKDGGGIDVAVVDLCMPGMGGIATLRAIKERDPRIEVIMLTGHGSLETGIEAIREGAYDYLMKPCDPIELIEKINEAATLSAIRACPVLWPRTRAEEILFHPFRPLTPRQSLADALAIFVSDGEAGSPETLFVVDEKDRVCGRVTRQDLVREAGRAHPEQTMSWERLAAHPEWLPRRPLEEILGPDVMTTGPRTPLAEVARRMIHHRFRSMPVVDGQRFVGVIRLRDALKYLQPIDPCPVPSGAATDPGKK